ncbi:MAG TPA: glycosyltransferase [Beijerinckia sp.]|jgi:ceramide glucosyltransferase|nr:glycosyltransferase [Beijerinckia sp.]
MAVFDYLSIAAAIWWCLAVLVFCICLCASLIQPFVQKRRATNDTMPPVSVIVPIKLLDPGFDRAQSSIFAQNYPDYEILISAAEETSPALDAAQNIARANPAVPCRILHSDSTFAVSPKLNNLTRPLEEAAHDFVFTKDSNITLEPDTMREFLRNFAPGVGLVVAVPVAVRPQGLAGQIEAFLINGHARLLLTASVLGAGFGVGKVMVFRRSDLAKAGGIEAISHSLAEDSAISKGLGAIGLKTVFAHRTVAQEIGARGFREIYERQARWAVIRHKEEPFSFPLEPLSSPLPAALAAVLAAPLIGVSGGFGFVMTLTGWFCAEIACAYLKKWEVSIWSPLAFLGREILSLVAWLRAWTTHDVVWAKGRFDAREGARGGDR